MIDRLDGISRDALVDYRIKRAEETIKEVYFQRDNGYFSTAINRLYYACYYAAMALLIANGIQPTTHAGVKLMLGLHFVKTGKLSIENGRAFNILFERRHSSDYDDFISSTQEEVDELLVLGEKFIKSIKEIL